MKTFLIAAALLLLLAQAGCSSRVDTQEQDAHLLRMLQGNWKSKHFSNGWRDKTYTFCLEDTLCSVIYPSTPDSRVKIRNGVLHIWENLSFNKGEMIMHHRTFAIIGVTKNYLKLAALDPESKSGLFLCDSDTIVFRRVTEQHILTPERISVYHGVVHRLFPRRAIAFDIDPSGNVRYFGDSAAEPKGGQRGHISSEQYNEILHALRCVPEKALEIWPAMSWEGQCIAIRTNGRWGIVFYYQDMVELSLFENKLYGSIDNIKWTPDAALTLEDFQAFKTFDAADRNTPTF